jgi:hypothetical protein
VDGEQDSLNSNLTSPNSTEQTASSRGASAIRHNAVDVVISGFGSVSEDRQPELVWHQLVRRGHHQPAYAQLKPTGRPERVTAE